MTASDKDGEHMRRIGVYEELSHREAQAEHLALPLDERSWRLYQGYRHRFRRDDPPDDPTPFYDKARALGLYES